MIRHIACGGTPDESESESESVFEFEFEGGERVRVRRECSDQNVTHVPGCTLRRYRQGGWVTE